MCMLTYCPAGIEPDAAAIWNGAVLNDDGHGWAIVDPSRARVITGRSLDPNKALDEFESARRRFPAGPAMFHSRWATHGAVKTENVHPFRVGGDKRTLLGHNGVLPREAHPKKGDPRSDTRKFAQSMLPRWGNLDRLIVRNSLEAWLGSGNKVLILTANPRYKRNAYLLNEKRGIWDESGVWYSNSDYLPRPPRKVLAGASVGGGLGDWVGEWKWDTDDGAILGAGRGQRDAAGDLAWWHANAPEDYDPRDCVFCGSLGGVSVEAGACTLCYSCQDCGEVVGEDCQCYAVTRRQSIAGEAVPY